MCACLCAGAANRDKYFVITKRINLKIKAENYNKENKEYFD